MLPYLNGPGPFSYGGGNVVLASAYGDSKVVRGSGLLRLDHSQDEAGAIGCRPISRRNSWGDSPRRECGWARGELNPHVLSDTRT
jgi:hypothetical protein